MPDIGWLVGLLTPAEWQAVLWLMLLIYSLTELAKRLYRAATARYTRAEVWFGALVVGFAGAFFVWPEDSAVEWWIAGLCAGPMSSVLHRLAVGLLERISPELAAAVTGDRRRRDLPPPGGIERRAS